MRQSKAWAALILLGALGAPPGCSRGGQAGKALRVSGNIEATTVGVSFKLAGRVTARLVDEGDVVKAAQPIATLDDEELRHEVALRAAQAEAAAQQVQDLKAWSRPQEVRQAEAAVQEAQAALEQGEAAVTQAGSGLRQAEARLAALEAGSRPQEIAAAEATVRAAMAHAEHLKIERLRAEALVRSQAITQQECDAAVAAHDVAVAQVAEAQERLKLLREGPRKEDVDAGRAARDQARANCQQTGAARDAARAALARAQAALDLAKAGPREHQLTLAEERVKEAQAALQLAQARLAWCRLASPISGVVVSKNVEPGEYVAAGTAIVTVADLDDIWLRAYVDETELGRVKLGQRAQLTTDTFPGKTYQGRLTFISPEAEFTPKTVQTQKERVKLVYRVKIRVANPERELKPGMPADAEIVLE